MEGEVILFQSPSDNNTVFIHGFNHRTTIEDLVDRLTMYGPLLRAKIVDKSKPDDDTQTPSETSQTQKESGKVFAVASFYSLRQAQEAVAELNGIILHGSRISFRLRPPPKVYDATQVEKIYPLTINQCIEMANSFIGYNKWCSKIENIQSTELEETDNGFRCVFQCTIRHILKEDGRYCEGFGVGESVQDLRYEAINYARKKAVTEARKNAFSRMAIILLENNKAMVYVPDCPLPEALLEPEEEVEETDEIVADYGDEKADQFQYKKREREEVKKEEPAPMGVWARGLQLNANKRKKTGPK
eukprot:TRINITY_DN11283_c0_g1_i1.p1 TRINITY_DN11283_c0_g1~~TRINITY_DN11283_c0_g1_i1.p1  ORF type:complete len:302 (+),score=58.87 TRINITY_DN11283_c0_g1_i1:11-916(+)